MDDRSNIVLTGFMGTGKSTVGLLLADRLDRSFVDTDIVIAERHGPIHEIFDRHGEEAFRQMERELATELGAAENAVIATGGRMMLDASNIDALGSGRVFTLVADADEIHRRVATGAGLRRPLLEVDDPLARIRTLLADRARGYGIFTQIQSGGRSPASVADEIASLVERGVIEFENTARVAVGVSELTRWRSYTTGPEPYVAVFGTDAADRLRPLLGDVGAHRTGTVVAIGGLPPDDFGLYVPTDLPALLWWVSHPETQGDVLVDVGLYLEDAAGLAMLDQYLTDFTDGSALPWSGRSGSHPGLLAWLLDSVEAVCRRHGFALR